MPQVYATVLRPASGGFGAWDWVEGTAVEGCETIEDYESMSDDHAGADLAGRWERTDELSGRIHNERGQVYRIKHELTAGDRANGLKEGGRDTFVMAWVQE